MKFIRGLASDSSGVTGLETAVVLLSFFVVASVLGISVTKMGQATSSGSTQVVAEQLTESVPILKPKGLVMAIRTGDGQTYPHHVSAIVVPLITYSAAPVKLNREQIVISYYDGRQYAQDLPWTARWIRGDSHEDNLDPEELVEVVVELSSLDPKLREHTNFTLEFKLLQGAITRIEPSTPARLDPVSALSY